MTNHNKTTETPNLKIREPYQKIIQNLSRNIDIASEQYTRTGDTGYLWQYERLKKELCELKEEVKAKEAKAFGDLPSSFTNRN